MSADAALGVPFNIASYALLTHMIAAINEMEVGYFVHSFGDLHLYSDHIDGMKEAIERRSYELPRLVFKGNILEQFKSAIYEKRPFDLNAADLIVLEDYYSHPPVKFKMAV